MKYRLYEVEARIEGAGNVKRFKCTREEFGIKDVIIFSVQSISGKDPIQRCTTNE